MRFEFATATRIVFGHGAVGELPALARGLGGRALIVTGRDLRRAEPVLAALNNHGVGTHHYAVSGEPTIESVEQGLAVAKAARCDCVIGFGGGSAIDCGKAIAAMMRNEGNVREYLEVIGQGRALSQVAAPFIAVPTTAGTGSEVTRNAVLGSTEHKVKVSLRSPHMLPKLAVVDPELTLKLPPSLTAATGLDALTQVIEPFVSCRANPMTDAVCREGIVRVARSLRVAFNDGANVAAREDMSLASLCGGLALANAGLGAVHGFAGPIGGMFAAPHGATCAALLPQVMEINLRALRARDSANQALGRYQEVARLMTGELDADADRGVEWVRQLVRDLQIPRLGSYGIRAGHLPALVENASRASSMKANPIVLTEGELTETLKRSL